MENSKRGIIKKTTSNIQIHIKLSPAKPTVAYDTYWKFAGKRQDIFFKRFHQEIGPWTDDEILKNYKFTNTYRASDRVSQYLIKNVIYSDHYKNPNDIFFRIMLFKFFNKIETWELFEQHLGEISYESYSRKVYDQILTKAMNAKQRIFSAAYIMPSGCTVFGNKRKHLNLFCLLEKMMDEDVPKKLTEMKKMQQGFDLLRSYPMIGDFLAYQFITDINYSTLTAFSEKEFVIPGPGALNGIKKCFSDFGGLSFEEIIKFMTDIQLNEFERLGIDFKNLWGRDLRLIDCQNIFCEVDKYSRIAHPELTIKNGRTRIKQIFKPNLNKIEYEFPPKWGIKQE